jgi:hypothetical protein
VLNRRIAHHVTAVLISAVVAGGCVTIELAAPATADPPLPTPVIVAIATETPPATEMAPTETPAAPATAGPTATGAATPTPTDAPTATPSPTPTPTATAFPTATPTATPRDPPTGGVACEDDAFTLNGERWDVPFVWFFNDQDLPRGLDADRVVEIIERSFDNIANAWNDCGLPDNIEISSRYAALTNAEPCPDRATDEINVVGFQHLPPREASFLAYVCPYDGRPTSWRTDMVINADVPWALSLEECGAFDELLEATITHEVGHIFGLGHVGERRHGQMTMSTRSNGPCATDEITLGLGDVLGLEAIYAAN